MENKVTMLFVIDIGNSHTVTGLYDNDRLIAQWRLKSDRARTADELTIRYHTLFGIAGISPKSITNVVIASVVPQLETCWVRMCRDYFSASLQAPPFVVNHKSVSKLITIDIDNPSEVGADRLVNGISAWQKYRQDLVVIDFGTAITFDCVSVDCCYLGGMILPGIALSLDALAARTAKLPQIDISSAPTSVIGKNTVDAMHSGAVYGYGAMISGIAEKIRTEMVGHKEQNLKVIATGGIAEIIAPYSPMIDIVDPLLTLNGLKIIYDATQ
jgi:type III pantothenate kinase